MNLKKICLKNFRNHSNTELSCSLGLNIVLGNNGEGKTNLLEGISYACLSKSFFTSTDTSVLQMDQKEFSVTGSLKSDSGIDYDVVVEYAKDTNKKSIYINKGKIEKASLMIGKFPVVILSPEHGNITNGSPSHRRNFIDFVVSQSSRKYLEDLIDYKRILKQRNKILAEYDWNVKENKLALEAWNERFVSIGSDIVQKRIEFIEQFSRYIIDAYKSISDASEMPSVFYSPSFTINGDFKEDILKSFSEKIYQGFSEEKKLGCSLYGPHRDEICFNINNLNLKNYASQGQHKTFLVALKLAEYFYLKSISKETPILLLDDVLSYLDNQRAKCLIELTSKVGQVFLSSTEENIFNDIVDNYNQNKIFIQQGKIVNVEERQ